MKFARWVFRLSAIYGTLVTTPLFFLEERIGRDFPPPITHPEYLYGFAGVVIAWQIMFFLVSLDPIRLRPVMIVGVFEKLGFVIAAPILYFQGRLPAAGLFFTTLDAVMMVLFFIAWVKTRPYEAEFRARVASPQDSASLR